MVQEFSRRNLDPTPADKSVKKCLVALLWALLYLYAVLDLSQASTNLHSPIQTMFDFSALANLVICLFRPSWAVGLHWDVR